MGICLSKNVVQDIGQVIRIKKSETKNDPDDKLKERSLDQNEKQQTNLNKNEKNSYLMKVSFAQNFSSLKTETFKDNESETINEICDLDKRDVSNISLENRCEPIRNKNNEVERIQDSEKQPAIDNEIENLDSFNSDNIIKSQINDRDDNAETINYKSEIVSVDAPFKIKEKRDNIDESITIETILKEFEPDSDNMRSYATEDSLGKSILDGKIEETNADLNYDINEYKITEEIDKELSLDVKDPIGEDVSKMVLDYINKLISNTVEIYKLTLQDNTQTINDRNLEEKIEIENSKLEFTLDEKVDLGNLEKWRSLVNSLCQNETLNSYALSKKRDQFASISELITYLSKYECQNKIEKAWLVYVWITDNIEYNLDGYVKGDYGENDATNVLKNGKSVCAGYSNLFEELTHNLGIECRSVVGYSKAFSYKLGQKIIEPNHEWNLIKIDDQWFNVEPTWGAGYGDWAQNTFVKRFEPYWFLTPDEIFMYKHYTEELYPFEENSLEKNFTRPSSLEEFEQMPALQLDFHLNGLSIISPDSFKTNCVISSSENPLIIEIDSPKQTLLMANLKDVADKNLVLVERDSQSFKYRIICFLPEPNRQYELHLFAKSSLDQHKETFDCVAQYLVESSIKSDMIKNEINLPKYTLEFKYGLICLSHSSRFISSKSSMVDIEFLGDKKLSIIGKLKEKSGNTIKNTVLIQETAKETNDTDDGDKKIFKIKLILPDKDTLYNFEFFASENQKNIKYEWAGEFLLSRSNNDGQNQTKFVKTYLTSLDSFIYSPIDYNLNSSQMYTFKYYIKDALEVALVDVNDKWNYLQQTENGKFLWSKEMCFETRGELCLYVKFEEDSEFNGFCSYEIV